MGLSDCLCHHCGSDPSTPAALVDNDIIDLPIDGRCHQQESIRNVLIIAVNDNEAHTRPNGKELAPGVELADQEVPEFPAGGLLREELLHGKELHRQARWRQAARNTEIVKLSFHDTRV